MQIAAEIACGDWIQALNPNQVLANRIRAALDAQREVDASTIHRLVLSKEELRAQKADLIAQLDKLREERKGYEMEADRLTSLVVRFQAELVAMATDLREP